jgi:hypothetical protein
LPSNSKTASSGVVIINIFINLMMAFLAGKSLLLLLCGQRRSMISFSHFVHAPAIVFVGTLRCRRAMSLWNLAHQRQLRRVDSVECTLMMNTLLLKISTRRRGRSGGASLNSSRGRSNLPNNRRRRRCGGSIIIIVMILPMDDTFARLVVVHAVFTDEALFR